MVCRKCRKEIPDGSRFCMLCGADQNPPKQRKALKRANGTGSIYKLPGRRKRPWAVVKNKTYIGYYETKTAALEAAGKLSGRDITERYNMTFAEVFESWKAEHYREISTSGIASYDRAYDIFESLHNRKFRDIKAADYQAVIDKHLEKQFSTLSKYKQLITQMSKWAMREEIITSNFASFVKLPENVRKEKSIFTTDEIARIEADGSETARIVLMLLSTGMRIGELFNLKLEDYHETYVIGGSKTTTGRNRVIPIRPEGRPHFQYFALLSKNGDKLLSGYSGNKNMSNFRKRDYNDLMDKLKIDKSKTPHSTRHTYTSRAVKEGMAPEILQRILGHADYSTTANVYTHIDIDTIVKSVETVSNL